MVRTLLITLLLFSLFPYILPNIISQGVYEAASRRSTAEHGAAAKPARSNKQAARPYVTPPNPVAPKRRRFFVSAASSGGATSVSSSLTARSTSSQNAQGVRRTRQPPFWGTYLR